VIGTRIEEVAAGERCGVFSACFVAGTPMDLVGGSKPIEQVRDAETSGRQCDRIWSRDQFDPDGPIVARRVLRKFVRVSPVLNLDVGGRRIGTTREHPFFAEGRGWTPAGELRVGEQVLLKSGRWLRIDGVADSGRVETVYNLEVEDEHTYFVGSDEWGFAVWAHNAGYGNAHASTRPATLYVLVNAAGQILKWGITNNPLRRYSQKFLTSNGARLDPLMIGPRSRMAQIERSATSQLPGPLNHEPWAGAMFPR
jgi:hypothetical protein